MLPNTNSKTVQTGSAERLNPTPTQHFYKTGYIPGIDGLRALAVVSVIMFHFNGNLLPGGFTGVDVFFVISGYVVSASLAKELHSTFWRFAIDFYSRRILRIYPALVLCLLVTAILQTLFVPSSWLSNTSHKTGIAAFFGMSNFALIWFSDGYFSPRVEFNTFTHTWSLAVEEQFYLLFPLVFYIWLKWRDSRSTLIHIISNSLLVSLLALSFLISYYQTEVKPDHAFYLLPSRFWELACGALLFKLIAQRSLIIKSRISSELSIIGGLILISLGFVFSDPNAFPYPWALLPVTGALLVIGSVTSELRNESLVGRLLTNPPIVYIGKISYSLYLWHWPVVVLFRWTVGLEYPQFIALALFLVMSLSVFSFHFIERPVRQSTYISSKPNWLIVFVGVVAITLGSLVTVGIFKLQPSLSLSVTKDKDNWYPYPDEHPAGSKNTEPTSQLFLGRQIFVLGDSHAEAYGKMLRMLKDQHDLSVHIFSKAGCSVANLLMPSSPECSQFIANTIKYIRSKAKPDDIVFLASLRMNRLGDQWAVFDDRVVQEAQSSPNSRAMRATALQEAESIISSFESMSLTVIIDAPKPIFRSPPFRCSDWFNSQNPICKAGSELSRTYLLKHREPVMESLRLLNSSHPRLVVWDPFPLLCPGEVCLTKNNGLPIFFDGDHLSGHGNKILYPSFASVLNGI